MSLKQVVSCFIFSTFFVSAISYTNQPLKADSLNPSDTNTAETSHAGLHPNHVRGARIYDDFIIETDGITPVANPYLDYATPTDPNMPPPSIPDGWRCSHCHGFNYKGGIYTFENGVTNNLLGLKEIRQKTEDDIVSLLMNGMYIFDGVTNVNVHNYATFLSAQEMVDVSDFVVNEIFDTDKYIRASTNEGLFNHMPSMYIYRGLPPEDPIPPIPVATRVDGSSFRCTECHGVDGRLVPGIDLYLLAWEDPFKWLHRVNFGSPRSQFTYPDIRNEDASIHPGLYEVMLTRNLTFAGAIDASRMLEYVQTHFLPVIP